METEKNRDISHYLEVLSSSKTDNEKFAALLMVAKKTKNDSGDVEVKKQILEAVGVKFFSRLLKTKTVPEDCPANIYKSVAMSVLSALCSHPDGVNNEILLENIPSFNKILLISPGEDDIDDRQLIDDTYECLNNCCQTWSGLEALMKAISVSTLCEVVISQNYGFERAHDLICCLVSYFGPDTWDRCEAAYHQYLLFIGKQFLENNGLHKFEMCNTLVFLLTAAPNDKEETIEPPWIRPIVRGLDNIMRSKLESEQREPALKLASTMVQVCGIYSMQPPYCVDHKLFLLTTHLCCVEVRMVLEDPDLTQANRKGSLLSSCYTFLENVINHLTSGPPLDLVERQVMQLHSAMVGAFRAVIYFLKRIAEDTNVQWNSILLATVRVLGAWMAEETSALREEIYDLIPFLIQVSKLCIPAAKNKNVNHTEQTNSDNQTDNKECSDKHVSEKDKALNHQQTTENGHIASGLDNIDDDKPIDKTKADCYNEGKDNVDNIAKTNDNSNATNNITNTDMSSEVDNMSIKCDSDKTNATDANGDNKGDGKSLEKLTDKEDENRIHMEQDVLTEEELTELHLNADILHYLLPGLCHLTAEKVPRRLLLDSGALGLLDLYMWRQWEKLVDETRRTRETISCIVILCNIFLNLVIVEPEMVKDNQELSHILLLVATGIQSIEKKKEYMVVWSHVITLGLMLMRTLHSTTEEFLETESVTKFFQSAIIFLSGAYTAKHRKKSQSVLDIVESYKLVWDQISQTWFLSMQAFAACIPLYKDLPDIILKTGWLPSLLKVIADVKANTVAEETKSCFQLLLTTIARENKTARAIIKEKGGDSLARFFK